MKESNWGRGVEEFVLRYIFILFCLSSFFLFLAVQNVRDVSALTLEKIVYILQCF